MLDLYILGSGGFAREVAWLVADIERAIPGSYRLRGFIGPQADQVTFAGQSFPVVAENDFLENLVLPEGGMLALVLGLGNPHLSFRVLRKIREHPKVSWLQFPSLIHPSFVGCPDSIQLGEGNILTAGVIFTLDISIGSFNIFNLNTTVGHDSQIGSYNVFNPGCNISGSVRVGDRNLVGTNATVLQGLELGSDLIVGAGSVVTRNLSDRFVYVGSPAKPIRAVEPSV